MTHDFLKTLDAFDNATSSRRDAIRKAGRLGANAALAALPLFASSKSAVARSSGPDGDAEILNYALTLGYLKRFFYEAALKNSALGIPDSDRPLFEEISANENAQVEFLSEVITDLERTPVVFEANDFDFTAGGTYDLDDYDTFLTLSQSFEDLGQRAYKGQAARIETAAILTAALQIHSVMARQAAAVRRLRGNQGWIPNNQPGAAVPAIYAGEENVIQGNVDLSTSLPGVGTLYTVEQITEAFDEPLSMEDVTNEDGTGIADPFFA
ncbi:MAG: ferritin-like domain-containing protein [Bacteroidota bacterium]